MIALGNYWFTFAGNRVILLVYSSVDTGFALEVNTLFD
jgi:hypothetical protein